MGLIPLYTAFATKKKGIFLKYLAMTVLNLESVVAVSRYRYMLKKGWSSKCLSNNVEKKESEINAIFLLLKKSYAIGLLQILW